MKTINIEGKDFTIEELQKLIANSKEKKDWEEQAKGSYYVTQNGSGRFQTNSCSYSINLSYAKETDADIFAKKIDLFNRMNLFALIHNEGWEVNWCDVWETNEQKKWGIEYIYNFKVEFYRGSNFFLFGIAVKSKEIAEAMLEEFKDELEIYLK